MIEVVKFSKITNEPVAIKQMQLEDWKKFKKFTKDYYYKAYEIGYSKYKFVSL